jgi:hypothetical protein
MTDSQMPPEAFWDGTEAPGHAHCLFHPYGGDDAKAFENGVQVRFWGWDWYVAHGGTRPVLATQWEAPSVPDGMLLGIYNGVESGDDPSAENLLDIANARAIARARGVGCWLYFDANLHEPAVQARVTRLLPEAADEELILIVRCYPITHDLALDEGFWRDGLTWAKTAIRPGGNRIAMVRKVYVRVDDTIGYVEHAQPVYTRLANEIGVVADMPFSGWRESGIYRPRTGTPSNRLVLEPWLMALEAAATERPARFIPRPAPKVDQPKPDPPKPQPKPKGKGNKTAIAAGVGAIVAAFAAWFKRKKKGGTDGK